MTLTLHRVQFFNVKGSEAEEEGALTFMPSFQQNVSLNNSGVHIPLEIYEGCKYQNSSKAIYHEPKLFLSVVGNILLFHEFLHCKYLGF